VPKDGKAILVPARDCEKMQGAAMKGVWLWCLEKSARRKRQDRVRSGSGFRMIDVAAGQFAYQRGVAVEETGLPGSTIHDIMGNLVDLGKITYWSPPDNPWTIVTIVDYQKYIPHKAGGPTTQNMPELPEALGTPEFAKVWEKFLRFRRSDKKKPIGPIEAEAKLKFLSKFGPDKAARRLQCLIDNGWLWQLSDDWEERQGSGQGQDAADIGLRFAALPAEKQHAYYDRCYGDRHRAKVLWWREEGKASVQQ